MPVLGGFGYGSGGAQKAVVSSSTAAGISNVSSGGLPAKAYRFTGTGHITLSRGGLLDVLVQGPGGPGGEGVLGGGGAGGFIEANDVFLPTGQNLVYVGAGVGPGFFQGISLSSFIGPIVAVGGGNAAWVPDRMPSGGGCGGGNGGAAPGTPGFGYYGQGLIAVSPGVTRGGNGAGFGGGGGGIAGDASGASGGPAYNPGASWAFPGPLGAGGGNALMIANSGNGGNFQASGNSGVVIVRVYR